MAGLALTLVLPIYPEGVSGSIAAFLGLAALGGLSGLAHRGARQVLVMLLPWMLALLVAFLIGGLRGASPQQAVEDTVPYALAAVGLLAGRGASHPRKVLGLALVVCVIDAVLSIYKMPSFGAGMRSTYSYFRITAGLPLVGLYLLGLLAATRPKARRLIGVSLLSLFVVAIGLTVSRGMILATCIGFAVALHVRKPSLLWLGAIVLGLAAVIYASTLADLGWTYLRAADSGTIEGRLREVRGALEYFVAHPVFGAGLGGELDVDGHAAAFVHNVVAYHLWKFGLFGCALLLLPCAMLLGQAHGRGLSARAVALGATAAIVAYLVTCAAYKTYYLVWIYGVVGGASLSWLRRPQWTATRRPIKPAAYSDHRRTWRRAA